MHKPYNQYHTLNKARTSAHKKERKEIRDPFVKPNIRRRDLFQKIKCQAP